MTTNLLLQIILMENLLIFNTIKLFLILKSYLIHRIKCHAIFKIIHETSSKFMDSILREGKLLTSNNLNKKFLTDSPKGQGSKNRKLCDSEESIKNREHFWKHCDEA